MKAAKQEVMDEITKPPSQPHPFPLPAFPEHRITRLLLDLKASLGRSEGQPVSYDDWGRITGRPGNTIAAWSAGGAAHQLQVLLASLERLTAEQRHRLVDIACREYPTLEHPRLIPCGILNRPWNPAVAARPSPPCLDRYEMVGI